MVQQKELYKDLDELKRRYKEKYGFSDPESYAYKSEKGINEEIVYRISQMKGEPEWMTDFRLKSYRVFARKPLPTWGPDLSAIDFQNIFYYIKPTDRDSSDRWEDVPEYIKKTFDKLGIPEAERKMLLGGVAAQYESEVVYHNLIADLEKQGVIFLDTDTGLKKHPELFRKYFGTVIPPNDNKFAALNSAVWSGGSFIYVPPGVKVKMPLQAYFRINAKNVGQFERTLIIADKGSYVHYVEGCTAPVYSSDSLHSAVVELVALEGARLRYTTIQNWSTNVYNLVTKRAIAYKDATVEWVDCNIGSKITQKYPSVYMVGEGARGEILSLAFAGPDQVQDAGGKLVFSAPNTSGTIISKSISKGTGKTVYRGLIKVGPNARNSKAFVRCDALLLDEQAASDTIPYMEVENQTASVGHEATVSKIGSEQLFYLMSRGLSEAQATDLIVRGFIEPIVKELPMEYALEMNRLIELQIENPVG